MANVLIVANRTVGGRKLLDAVRERAHDGARFHLVVPLSRPRHGNVIYDHAARDAAQLRIELVTQFLRQAEGIELSAEIGDEDPFTATLDALHDFRADEVIISTLPETRSGWLRRGLVERIEEETGRRSEEHTSELQSRQYLVCRLLLEKKKTKDNTTSTT